VCLIDECNCHLSTTSCANLREQMLLFWIIFRFLNIKLFLHIFRECDKKLYFVVPEIADVHDV